ncbi:hypothetical protein Esti_000296 [Eimeria stiedai]
MAIISWAALKGALDMGNLGTMKTWRQLLTLFALSSVWVVGSQAVTAVDNANLAASGLQAFGRLLHDLISPDGDFDEKLDAVSAFVKPLISGIASSEAREEAAKKHVDHAVDSLRRRQAVEQQMALVAAAIDAGAAGEERHNLKKMMQDLLSSHSQILFEIVVHTYQALGMSKEEAEAAVNNNPALYFLGFVFQAHAVGKYYDYALLPGQ